MSDDEADVFNGELPNFDAFRGFLKGRLPESAFAWVDKLEAWSKGALAELEATEKRLQGEVEDADERIVALEKELTETRDAAEELDILRERVLDMDRGLVTPGELHLEVRSLG